MYLLYHQHLTLTQRSQKSRGLKRHEDLFITVQTQTLLFSSHDFNFIKSTRYFLESKSSLLSLAEQDEARIGQAIFSDTVEALSANKRSTSAARIREKTSAIFLEKYVIAKNY